MKHIFLPATAALLLFASCSKHSDATAEIQPGDTGSIEIEFDNIVGGSDLQLHTATYTNAAGEAYQVSAFKYYVSNLRLVRTDGSVYTYPKDSSYFLIDEAAAEHSIELENVPAGDYNGIAFTIGVDSLKSVAPAGDRTGDLDPAGAAADMYWNATAGYIFLKMEGVSPAVAAADHRFSLQVGGFSGSLNNLRDVALTAPAGMSAKIRRNKTHAPEAHLFVDAARVLSGPASVSLAAHPLVQLEPYSATVAGNYASMFSINHIHND